LSSGPGVDVGQRAGAAPSVSAAARSAQAAARRLRGHLVAQIQEKLAEDGARPTISWSVDNFAHWPHAKNLIPHHSLYSFGRMQDVWLDK
jgi:peptide/nickel transport system substrate-binding protein